MTERIPFVQIDTSGAPALDAVADGAALVGTEEGLLIAGKDGSNSAQFIKTGSDGAVAVTDNAGSLTVDDGNGSLTVDGSVSITGTPNVAVSNFPATQPVSGSVSVSNLPATQAVSAASLPLPTGAATSAKQPVLGTPGTPSADVLTVQGTTSMTALKVDGSTVTQPVSGSLSVSNFPATQPVSGIVSVSNLPATQPVSGSVSVSNLPATQAVSAAALPLPVGAATAAKQAAIGTAGTPATDVLTVQGATSMTALKVDGSGVTQPVSGSLSVSNFPATQGVSVASLPLPTGASTAAKQPAVGTAGSAASDVLTVQGISSMTALKVDGSTVTQPVSGSVGVSNFPATQAVSAAALPLPTGAATVAKQPALGAAGTPSADVLTVQGTTSMTALKVDGSTVTQPVSGSLSVSNFPATQAVSAAALPLPTGASTSAAQTTGNSSLSSIDTKVTGLSLDATLTGGTQKAIVRGGAKGSTGAADVTSLATGTNHQALAVAVVDASGNQITTFGSGSVSVSNFPATQAVSAVALPLPTGAATAAKQPTPGTAGAASADVLTVQGAASMTALKVDGSAVTQPVSGSVGVSNFPATQPVSAVSLPLPSGAATETTLSARLADATFTGRINTLGQKTAAASTPVVFASDQSALTVTTAAVSDTVSGPTSMAALNNTVVIAMAGKQSCSVQLAAGTFAGTILAEHSVDGGSTYQATYFVDPTTEARNPYVSFTNPNPAGAQSIMVAPGVTNVRLRVSAFTSGSLSGTLRATSIPQNTSKLETAPTGTPTPPNAVLIGGTDGTNLTAAVIKAASTAAVAADKALVVAISPNNAVAVTATALPLPTGASSAAKQPALGSAGTPSADVLTVQGAASMTALKVDGSAVTQPVSAVALPLPSGASTSALQTTGNTSVGNIDTKTPALGQAVMAGSSPVVIASNQSSIPVSGSVTATISGTVPVSDNAGSLTVDSPQLPAALVSGRLSVDGSAVTQPVSIAAAVPITDNAGSITVDGTVTIVPSGTQTVSGTVTANLGTLNGAATAAKQPALGTTGSASTDVLTVQGIASMTALKVDGSAVTHPVSGTVTANIGTSGSLALDATLTSNNQRTRLTDGTNLAAIKAASTVPVAADPALVVALSPNSAVLTSIDTVKAQVSISTISTTTIPIVAGQSYNILRTQLSGTVSELTLLVEGSVNNTNWYTIPGFASPGVPATAFFNSPGTYTYLIGGFSYLRFNCQDVSTTVVVDYTLSKASAPYQRFSISDTTTGTPAAIKGAAVTPTTGDPALVVTVSPNCGVALDATLTGNNQRTRLTDGTNIAAVKAASTPAVATDPALVVARISPPTAALTNVSTSTTSAQLLAADLTRRAATIANDATAILYVKFGVTASATSYTVALAPAVGGVPSYYEVHRDYTGRIDAVLASGTGTARVTALT